MRWKHHDLMGAANQASPAGNAKGVTSLRSKGAKCERATMQCGQSICSGRCFVSVQRGQFQRGSAEAVDWLPQGERRGA